MIPSQQNLGDKLVKVCKKVMSIVGLDKFKYNFPLNLYFKIIMKIL